MKRDRLAVALSSLGLLILLVMSCIFWRERVFILDASFQCFSVIAEEKYAFQVGRYGAVLVQTLPMLLARLNLPLDWVIFSYSLSFTLYPLLLFGLLLYLKARELAVALGLYYLLIMTHTFYWIQSEQIQATALAMFATGWLMSERIDSPFLRYAGFLTLAVLTLYTYPLSVAALLFGVAYATLQTLPKRKDGYRKINLAGAGLMAVVLGLFAIKQFWLNVNWYDSKMLDLTDNLLGTGRHVFSLVSTNNFARGLVSDYVPFLVAWVGTTLFLTAHRHWLALAILWGACALWLMIVLTCFHYGPDQYYMESYYLMLGYFVAFPLALDVFPHLSGRSITVVMAAVIVARVGLILQVTPHYQARFAYVEKIADRLLEMPAQRYVVDEARLDMALLQASYDLPTATLMLTAGRGGAPLRTVLPYAGSPPAALPDWQRGCFPSAWACFPYERFASRHYFPLSDTSAIVELPGPVVR